MMKKYLILFILLIIPFGVNAAGGISLSPATITLPKGTTKTFEITAVNTIGDATISTNASSVIKVSPDYWETGQIGDGKTVKGVITVSALEVGKAVINVKLDGSTFDEDVIKSTKTINVVVTEALSNDTSLTSLSVDGHTLSPAFDNNVLNYSLTTSKNKIVINATASSGKTIKGTGTKTLNFGKNTFKIEVTAPAGNKKVYTIVVNRTDLRNKDNALKSLKISAGNIDFQPDVLDYVVNVEKDVKVFAVEVEANNEKAVISYLPSRSINLDNYQSIEISVMAENQSVRTYRIEVNRIEKDASLVTLNFDTLGGSSISPIEIEEGSLVDLTLYYPIKENFNFVGWYLDTDYSEKVDRIILDKDTKVYAKWVKTKNERKDSLDGSALKFMYFSIGFGTCLFIVLSWWLMNTIKSKKSEIETQKDNKE